MSIGNQFSCLVLDLLKTHKLSLFQTYHQNYTEITPFSPFEKTLVHLKSYAKTGKNVSSNEIIKSGDYRAEVLEAYNDITSVELKKEPDSSRHS